MLSKNKIEIVGSYWTFLYLMYFIKLQYNPQGPLIVQKSSPSEYLSNKSSIGYDNIYLSSASRTMAIKINIYNLDIFPKKLKIRKYQNIFPLQY